MTTVRPLDPAALSAAAVRGGALRGLPVTVLGLARSGIAATRFLVDAGALVTAYDVRPAADLQPALSALGGRSIVSRLGPDVDPAEVVADAALLVASPSVNPDFPTTEPRLRAVLAACVEARRGGDPTAPALLSEIDLFLRLCVATTVGVTGTKGKTTTASLVAAVLAADPARRVLLGGNIGRPLIETVLDLAADDRVVLELSELQLPTLSRGTDVAVYTNVTSDHLDRHESLEAYRRVKCRLAELTPAGGALVLNADDPLVADLAAGPGVTTLRYTTGRPDDADVGIVDGWIVAAGGETIMPLAELAIPGAHNHANALAGVATGRWFGLPASVIRTAVAGFPGVPDRLETVAVIDGVRFVNDSQGTQPDAVMAALRAFDRPIVLIAGGRDKGIDLHPLAEVVAERAAAAVLIGESGPALGALFRAAGLGRIEAAASMADAVGRAAAVAAGLATAGTGTATVLLSPAAASFDMFVDYADRGRAFRAAVEGLRVGRTAGREDER